MAILLFVTALLAAASSAVAAPPNATVVEYYRADVDHYVITASPHEQALLDDGVLRGWTRTGVSFFAWTDLALAPQDARPVCRFYGRPEAGLDSHFYSAFVDECADVQARFATAWQFESPAVFYVQVPDRNSGACPAGTDPVYRVFDNRTDANHRYLVALAARAGMQARGWIPEGYGPDAVVMCAPQARSSADDVALTDATFYSTLPGASLSAPVEATAVTHHAIVLPDRTVHYTATAGHLTARDPQSSQAEASFFYVAYTADGQDPATRPVTFFYNGGPGSATVWLHLGSFGPKRLATSAPSTTVARPFPFVDNVETLLDTSDLVFVDAVGSGLSEAIAPLTNQSWWGVDRDARVFRDFVTRYVTVNGRGASPKYLFGESYGTTRTALLANLLETAGTHLAGIVLQSSVLDYNSNCGVVDSSMISCAGYLPTYGATGAYFGLVSPPPADVAAFHRSVETFAVQTYAPAVSDWVLAMMLPAQDVLDALVADTGMRESVWRTQLNLGPSLFQRQLVPGTLLGRYDARMTAPSNSALASEGDPSSTFVSAYFGFTIQSYLQTTLKYGFPTTYVTLGNAINTWDFGHDGRPLPDTIPDLAAALAQNPQLQVLSLNGFHDLATPYFQTVLDLARLPAGAPVQFRAYDGGHMTYLDDTSRRLEKADLRAFLRRPLSTP